MVYNKESSKSEFLLMSRCYGSLALFLSIIHNVFLLYYIDMFVNVYKIDKMSFWIGEFIFLIWNSLNDPLFGWMSDKWLLQKDKSGASNNEQDQCLIVFKRIKSLQRNGPLFAFAFSLFWIKWLPTPLQFVISLCLYDSFLTCVDLQHTALLADLAVQTNDRNSLNRQCSIFSALGSVSVFASYAVWRQHSTTNFQLFCVSLTLFSATGFYLITKLMLKTLSKASFTNKTVDEIVKHESDLFTKDKGIGISTYLFQLYRNWNFRCFITMNLFQVFHCHFNSVFFPLFLDTLVGDSLPSSFCTLLIGFSFAVPHINNLYFLHLCKRYGMYNIIFFLLASKLVLSCGMLIIGSNFVWATCAFILSNRVFTEGTCKLLNLVISDLVDEDYVLHNRANPASALLFGVSSLLTKPGQTMAPIVGTCLISFYTGREVFQSGIGMSLSMDGYSKDNSLDSALYRDACFKVLVLVPILCSTVQLVAWSFYTLRGKRLYQIKNLRISRNSLTNNVY